jgi:hypothetical protein
MRGGRAAGHQTRISLSLHPGYGRLRYPAVRAARAGVAIHDSAAITASVAR